MLNLFRYGRIQSPIIWDVLGVSTYLTGCIRDQAFLAEQPRLASWRRRLYSTLAIGWTGTPQQLFSSSRWRFPFTPWSRGSSP